MEYEDYLAHYGVKGMKWGRRKDGSAGSKRAAKKEAKAEVKTAKKELKAKTREGKSNIRNRTAVEKQQRDQKHLTTLTKIASKEATSLISMTGPNNTTTLVTGKDFVDHVSRGGLLNASSTYLFYSSKSNYANENSRNAYSVSDAKAVRDLRVNYETARENYKNVKRGNNG